MCNICERDFNLLINFDIKLCNLIMHMHTKGVDPIPFKR